MSICSDQVGASAEERNHFMLVTVGKEKGDGIYVPKDSIVSNNL